MMPKLLYIRFRGFFIIFKDINTWFITPFFRNNTIQPYILIKELVKKGTITRVINIDWVFLLLCDTAIANGYAIIIQIKVVIIAIRKDLRKIPIYTESKIEK